MSSPDADAPPPPSAEVDHGRLARGFSIQLVGRLVSVVLSVFSLAITFRYLGVDDYGLLTAVVAFSGLFGAFSDIGLSAVTIRRAAAGKATIGHLSGINLGISVIYALPLWALTAAAGLVVYSGRPDYQLGVAIVATSLLIRAISSCYDAIFEFSSRFAPIALSDVTSRVLSFVLIVIAVRLDLGIVAFFLVQVAPTIVKLLVLVTASRQMCRVRPVFDRPAMLSLLREGLPLAAVSIVGVVYYRADAVLLSLLSTEEQVGAYGLGYRIAGNLSMIPMLFAATMFPTLTRLFSVSLDAYNAFARRTIEVIALFAVPAGVFGVLLAPDLVALFGSRETVPVATLPTRLLLVAIAVGFVNAVLAQCFVAAHDQGFLVRLGIAGLVVNIVLNLALDGRHGAAGAASALVTTEALSMTIALVRLHHVTGVRIPAAYATRLAIAGLATLAVWYLARDAGLLITLVLAVATFVGALMLDGPLRPSEIRALVKMLRPKRAAEPTAVPGTDAPRSTADHA